MRKLLASRFVLAAIALFASLSIQSCESDPTSPINESRPAKVELLSPADGASDVSTSPTLSWKTLSGVGYYRLQVSLKQDFSTIAIDTTWSVGAREVKNLKGKTTYYWHVRAEDSTRSSANRVGDWSETRSFTTGDSPVITPGMGSWFLFDEIDVDSAGRESPEGTAKLTAIQVGITAGERSDVTVFAVELSEPTPGTQALIQYNPNGDVALKVDQSWLDLPIATAKGYTQKTADSSNSSVLITRDLEVTPSGTKTSRIAGNDYEVRVIRVRTVTTYKYSSGSPSVYDDVEIYEYAPALGMLSAIISHRDDGSVRNISRLSSFELR